MGNHYHVLVETPRANLVRGSQSLQTAYTVWFNRLHNLSGHLFCGRHKAVLTDEGEPQGKMLYGYVGTVLDYLHLNPDRTAIVGGRSGKSLLDYRWSSLTPAYVRGPWKCPKWAHVEMALTFLPQQLVWRDDGDFLERPRTKGTGRIRSQPRSKAAARLISAVDLKRRMVFGIQAFRERLLALLPKSDTKCSAGSGTTL
jgi:hypothetical protein